MVHGHADLDLVQADVERAFHTNAVVGRQQHKSALGHRMARAGDDDGVGVR
jgi:hypothetical protein